MQVMNESARLIRMKGGKRMGEVTKTANEIGAWIQSQLKNASRNETESILPEMIRAYAELVKVIV